MVNPYQKVYFTPRHYCCNYWEATEIRYLKKNNVITDLNCCELVYKPLPLITTQLHHCTSGNNSPCYRCALYRPSAGISICCEHDEPEYLHNESSRNM